MRKYILAVMTAMLVLALATIAMAADDPFVGTWKTNIAKSVFIPGPPPGPGKGETVTITVQDNGRKIVADGWYADGMPFHVEHSAKFDGKDYPYTGGKAADTTAVIRIDDHTMTEVAKKAGKEISSSRIVVSNDGKTMTRTIKGKNAEGQETINIRVYDKQ